MELTPLRRASSGAVLGGVCAGLARRWQVDPTVLRIAMVLLALLGGLGIAFYVGALLLVPKDGSTDFPLYRLAPFTRSWSPAAAIGAVVGLGVLITVVVGSWLPFGIAPIVGLGFLWYFGFHRRRHPSRPDAGPQSADAVASPAATAGLPGAPGPSVGREPETDFERAAAAWRERVAQEREVSASAPYAASPLNDPVPVRSSIDPRPVPPAVPHWTPPVARTRRSRPRWLWPAVLCLTGGGLATLGVLAAFGIAVPGLAYVAVVLGALGLGLVVAAFTGRPRGLLPLTVVAGIATVAMLVPMPHPGRVGSESFSYSTMAQLPSTEQNYTAGEVTIDLRDLEVTDTRTVRYSQGAGTLGLTLPRTGNVIVDWSIGAGDYKGPDAARDGIDLKGSYQRILSPGAPVLTVVLHAGVGEVTVS